MAKHDVRSGEIGYWLDSGAQLTVRSVDWLGGISADDGDLVLVGTAPRPWAYVARPTSPAGSDCYIVYSAEVWDSGETVDVWVTTERGNASEADHGYLRLPKGPGYSEEVRENGHVKGISQTCLDTAGRVVQML